MNKYLKSFLKWAAAVILLIIPFIAGIGCKENGANVFYTVTGWLTMAEVLGIVVYIVIKNRKQSA